MATHLKVYRSNSILSGPISSSCCNQNMYPFANCCTEYIFNDGLALPYSKNISVRYATFVSIKNRHESLRVFIIRLFFVIVGFLVVLYITIVI